MAGGEFCGNATRALAYIALRGKPGSIQIAVSGVTKLLSAGVNKEKTSFAQMPILSSFSSVEKITKKVTKVTMEGITHLIVQKQKELTREELTNKGFTLLEQFNLLTATPATGVMFVTTNGGKRLSVDPVVWVRDVKTLFYETACASGTTALSLWKSLETNNARCTFAVTQPSRKNLTVEINKNEQGFQKAFLEGPIKILSEREFICQEK